MTETLDAREFQARLGRLDEAIRAVEERADPATQTQVREILQAVLELHAAGLERVLDHLGKAGAAALDACVRDDVVSGLFLLHGLHPLDFETRVHEALEQVRPYLRSHGGNVELVGLDDGVVRLRLVGSCNGCPSSAVTMQQTIEEAIVARAPDATAIEVEGAKNTPSTTPDGRPLVSLSVV